MDQRRGSDPTASLTPGSAIGHFRVERLLGAGGMGEVYLARDTALDRDVALKVLPDELCRDRERCARFRREAKAAAVLSHPNICTIFEIGEADGRTYICMEYVDGQTLSRRLADGPVNVDEVLEVAIQIADALKEAHGKGIVHRDLKSANILVTSRKQAKVLDFGLAKHLVPVDQEAETLAQGETAWTRAGQVLGTAQYMSPEQALGRAVDHRSDLFSFGVVLYELLTGRLPFEGSTPQETLDAVVHRDPPPLARFNNSVPDELGRIVGKLLEKDRDERYQSAHEVWVDLRHLRGPSSTSAGEVVQRAQPARRFGRLGLLVAGAGVLIAALVLGLALRFGRKPAGPPAPAGAGGTPSVLALPCKVFGAPEMAYLTDAVPSAISTLLGQVEGLEIMVPPTGLEVEKVHGDLVRIGDLYHAASFVVSSVSVEASRFVLNVQLVDAGSRRVLWSRQYEGARDSYNELAREAVDGIRQALKPAASPVVSTAGLAASSAAELAFREGKYFSNRYNNRHEPADFDLAFAAFTRALELDPKLADAAAETALLFVFKFEGRAPATETLPQVELWARRALEIDPKCGKAWTALIMEELQRPLLDASKMLEYGLKAAVFAPNEAISQTCFGHSLFSSSLALALEPYREAQRLDPLYLYSTLNEAEMLCVLGRPSDALPLVEKVLTIEPDQEVGLLTRALVLTAVGRHAEAERQLKRAEARIGESGFLPSEILIVRHTLELERGDARAAAASLQQIRAVLQSPGVPSMVLINAWEEVVPVLARHGRTEAALDILRRCIEAHVIPPYDWLMLSSDLASLRGDPRFQDVVRRSRVQLEETLRVLEQGRARGELPPYLEKPLAESRALAGNRTTERR